MVPDAKRDVTRVRDIMSKNVIHVPPYMEAVDALKVFNQLNIGRVVVLVDGKLIGILSRTDMVRAMDMLAAGLRPSRCGGSADVGGHGLASLQDVAFHRRFQLRLAGTRGAG